MNPTEFCDWAEKWRMHRFSAFLPGMNDHKAAIQTEFERRGYIVKWSNDYTDVTWKHPDGWITRDQWIAELELMKAVYVVPETGRYSPWFPHVTNENLSAARALVVEELGYLQTLPDSNYSGQRERLNEKLEKLLLEK